MRSMSTKNVLFIPTALKNRAQTMHILKRGKVPSGERAHFNIQNDDVIVSKVVDQIMIFFSIYKISISYVEVKLPLEAL